MNKKINKNRWYVYKERWWLKCINYKILHKQSILMAFTLTFVLFLMWYVMTSLISYVLFTRFSFIDCFIFGYFVWRTSLHRDNVSFLCSTTVNNIQNLLINIPKLVEITTVRLITQRFSKLLYNRKQNNSILTNTYFKQIYSVIFNIVNTIC